MEEELKAVCNACYKDDMVEEFLQKYPMEILIPRLI